MSGDVEHSFSILILRFLIRFLGAKTYFRQLTGFYKANHIAGSADLYSKFS